MVVVSDTTAITNFHQIKMLILLKQLYGRIIIPKAVYDELARFSNQKEIIENTDWIKVVEIKNKAFVTELLEILDKGESEAIALAIETNSDLLVIDERKGRKVAKQYGLRIIGTLGILTIAKGKKLIPSVKVYLDELINELDFHISKNLYEKVLHSVGEI